MSALTNFLNVNKNTTEIILHGYPNIVEKIAENAYLKFFQYKNELSCAFYVVNGGRVIQNTTLKGHLTEKSTPERILTILENWKTEAKLLLVTFQEYQKKSLENTIKSDQDIIKFKNAFGGEIHKHENTYRLRGGLIDIDIDIESNYTQVKYVNDIHAIAERMKK